MNTVIDSMIKTLAEAGFPAKVFPAPADAVTFDSFLVVYSDASLRTIRQVHLYLSKEQKFVARF